MSFITQYFGTARGLIRLGLSYGEVITGQDAALAPDPATVKRLVFVCHGNICRSAMADVVAQRGGLNAVSFGLSTDQGKPAHGPAIEAASALGYDLTAHKATRVQDFVTQAGDLLLAMETRHLRKLAALPHVAKTPRQLLGLQLSPPIPHLHDPYELDPAYMPVCLKRVIRAVEALSLAYPGARLIR
jgi:protein-tyrosine phosphatase